MSHRPDVQGDHRDGRPLIGGYRRENGGAGVAQDGKCVIRRRSKFRMGAGRDTGFEHGGESRGLLAREFQISPSQPFQGCARRRLASVPSGQQDLREHFEAALGDVGHQVVAVAEMAIRRGWADTRSACCLGDREAAGALFPDQPKRGLNEGFAQVAVMIAATFAAARVVDYAVHAKKKQGGLAGTVFVIRTRVAIDAKAIGAKLGAEQNADGTSYYRANGRGAMAGAIVFSPNNRLLVVVPAGPQQDAIFRTSLGGPKAKDTSMAGKFGDAGRKITGGHIWTLVCATGDMQPYISAMGEGIKKDFAPLGNQMLKSKFFGTYVMFGTSIKFGAGIDCESKETAQSIATNLSEGPLGKGDDSEVPNESKKILTFASNKVFKETFLANIKYTYTGDCAYLQSYMPFTKSQDMMRIFNNPSMGENR